MRFMLIESETSEETHKIMSPKCFKVQNYL